MASAVSPTLMLSELPNVATCLTFEASIFKTAKSETESCPTTEALTFLPLLKRTSTLFAPEMTWLFVTTNAVFPSFL